MSGWPALILAGGASRRMGQDKATMVVDGSAMISQVAHALRRAGAGPIVVQTHLIEQRDRVAGVLAHLGDVTHLLDVQSGRGSRDALQTGLAHAVEMGWPLIQLAPCDVPRIDANLFIELQHQLDSKLILPKSDGRLQPLLALVRPGPLLKRLGELPPKISLKDAMRSIPHQILEASQHDFDADCFLNINAPEDLARSRR